MMKNRHGIITLLTPPPPPAGGLPSACVSALDIS